MLIDLLIHPISAIKAIATSSDHTLSCMIIFAVTFALKIAGTDRDPAPGGMILLINKRERLEGPKKYEFVVQMWKIVKAAKW